MSMSRFNTRGGPAFASSSFTTDIGTRGCGGSDRVPVAVSAAGGADLGSEALPALMALARADNPRSHTTGLLYRSVGRNKSETVAAGVLGLPLDPGRSFDPGRGAAPVGNRRDHRARTRERP